MSSHNIGFYEDLTKLSFISSNMHLIPSSCLLYGGSIMLTCPFNVYPLTPHFYIVKLGFTGVYNFLFFCSKTKIVGTG